MNPGWLLLLLGCLVTLYPKLALAQDLPVFDAHIHYSQPDWAVYTPEAILGILDKAGVRWAMVSSTPDEGTIRLRYPDVRLLWAHTGLGDPFETVARVMEKHPTLLAELSLKDEVASGGTLDPRWKALFLRHPGRFMVGTDTWVTSQWDRLPEIHAGIHAWLRQLPRDVAERLACKNAARLTGTPH